VYHNSMVWIVTELELEIMLDSGLLERDGATSAAYYRLVGQPKECGFRLESPPEWNKL